MESNQVIRFLYTMFVGVLLALFVGYGISTFYEAPAQPKYPTELSVPEKSGRTPTAEEQKREAEFQKQESAYMDKLKPYNRNVSLIALASAVVLLAVSVAYEKRIKFVADGIMLGGLFTLLYSTGRGMASNDSKYMFMMVTIGLLIVLFLGYRRFAHDHASAAPMLKTKA